MVKKKSVSHFYCTVFQPACFTCTFCIFLVSVFSFHFISSLVITTIEVLPLETKPFRERGKLPAGTSLNRDALKATVTIKFLDQLAENEIELPFKRQQEYIEHSHKLEKLQ